MVLQPDRAGNTSKAYDDEDRLLDVDDVANRPGRGYIKAPDEEKRQVDFGGMELCDEAEVIQSVSPWQAA